MLVKSLLRNNFKRDGMMYNSKLSLKQKNLESESDFMLRMLIQLEKKRWQFSMYAIDIVVKKRKFK